MAAVAVVVAAVAVVVAVAAVVVATDLTAHLALTRSASPAPRPRLAGEGR